MLGIKEKFSANFSCEKQRTVPVGHYCMWIKHLTFIAALPSTNGRSQHQTEPRGAGTQVFLNHDFPIRSALRSVSHCFIISTLFGLVWIHVSYRWAKETAQWWNTCPAWPNSFYTFVLVHNIRNHWVEISKGTSDKNSLAATTGVSQGTMADLGSWSHSNSPAMTFSPNSQQI